MKKLSLILAGAFLLGGISFASPVVKKQDNKPKTEKKTTTKEKKTSTKSKVTSTKESKATSTAPATK